MAEARKTYRFTFLVLLTLIAEVVLALLLALGYFVFLHTIPGLRLNNPEWMWLFSAGPVLTLLFILYFLWKRRAIHSFSSPEMLHHLAPSISTGNPTVRFLLFRVALFFLTVAAINPQMGSKMVEGKQEGIEMMIAIDVSTSMLAEDIKPNRLERAKLGIAQLLDKLAGDRIGIIVFAGEAYVQLPATNDYSAARMFLRTISTDIVPVQGTSVGAAINMAMQSFDFESTTGKALLLITDGEDHEAAAIAAAEKAREKGVVIHTIGMGTVQGAPIPVMRGRQQVGYKKDKEGNTVITRLDEKLLQDISTSTGGVFVRASTANMGINQIMEEVKSMAKTEFDSQTYAEYDDRFQIFLGIALVLLLIEMLVSERKSKWREKFNLFEK